MITEYHVDIWATADERLRIYPDDDPTYYRDEDTSFGILVLPEGGDKGHDWVLDILNADGIEVALPDLAQEYGASVVLPVSIPGRRGGFIFDTTASREAFNIDLGDKEQITSILQDEAKTYRAWSSGQGLWVAVLEKRVVWANQADPTQTRETWEEAGSVYRILGLEDEAIPVALDYFPKPEQETTK